ncbi:MAG: ABC transporter permease subunit [Lachnospiraceae bacterium]|nr:ABC transporter permease subunit [Lachnospiraceae bacterium]
MKVIKKILSNPVFAKETKIQVRNIKFALTILFYNLILIAIAVFGFEVIFNNDFSGNVNYGDAIYVYDMLICLESLMVGFLVPAFTAGSIAGEREKQTLEILLTTTLKPMEIVWGKLMASICMILLLVVSSLPVISIIFTVGGINLTHLLQFICLVFVAAILIGSIGVWASAMLKKTVLATVFTFGGIIILCGISLIVVGLVSLIANMIYAVNYGTWNTPDPNISPVLLILLFNPGVSLVEMIMNQSGGFGMMAEMNDALGGGLPKFLVNHWFLFSLISQMGLAAFFMKQAEAFLNPLREFKSRKKKQKKNKKMKRPPVPPEATQGNM